MLTTFQELLNIANLSLNPHSNPLGGPYYYPCFREEDTEAQQGQMVYPGSHSYYMEAPESKLRLLTPESVFLGDCSTASHLLPSMVAFFLPGEGLSETPSEQSPPRSHQSGFSQRGGISSQESGHCSCSSQTGVSGQGKWDQRPRRCWGWSGEEDQAVAPAWTRVLHGQEQRCHHHPVGGV